MTNTITPNISDKTSVLVVGVEQSKVYGTCLGVSQDIQNMSSFFKNFSTNIIVLANENATIDNFSKSLNEVIKNDFAIIYYSGHGGYYKFNDNLSNFEIDGQDEFLCLYDGGFRDDSIWNIISKSKGRVFLIFDCCHSETMFRIDQQPQLFSNSLNTNIVNMLCWSGCPDNTSSYGDKDGGKFTNTILKYFSNGITYNELWLKCKDDKNLKTYQKIQTTTIGSFDKNLPCFR